MASDTDLESLPNTAGPVITKCIIDVGGKNVVVDVTMSEDHTYEADVSSYPIEAGSDITDNVRIKPLNVKWECIVSDTPIDPDGGLTVITGALPQIDAYDAIVDLFKAKQTMVIQDSLDVFDSMLITNVSIPRSAQNGSALVFTVSFQQALILENQRDTVHLGGQGGKGIVQDQIPAFSRPTSTRSSVPQGYELLITDKTSPNTPGSRALGAVSSWDHFAAAAAGAFGVTGNVFADVTANAALDALADGWVGLKDHLYHPYNTIDVAKAQALVDDGKIPFGHVLDAKYDVASGKYVNAKTGKPIVQDPAGNLGSSSTSDEAHSRWQQMLRDD